MDTHPVYLGIRIIKHQHLNGRVCFNVTVVKITLKGTAIKGNNIFFLLKVAPMRIENIFKRH